MWASCFVILGGEHLRWKIWQLGCSPEQPLRDNAQPRGSCYKHRRQAFNIRGWLYSILTLNKKCFDQTKEVNPTDVTLNWQVCYLSVCLFVCYKNMYKTSWIYWSIIIMLINWFFRSELQFVDIGTWWSLAVIILWLLNKFMMR